MIRDAGWYATPFPLTPTLSLREREQRASRSGEQTGLDKRVIMSLTQLEVRVCLCPGGTAENSPTFQRLHVVSLTVLLLLCFFVRKRSRRLCIVAWCGFWLSLLANVIPGFL